MTRRRTAAALLSALALMAGTACGPAQEPASTPDNSIESDLTQIESTLDAIESDLNDE